jgi:VanZ family protein
MAAARLPCGWILCRRSIVNVKAIVPPGDGFLFEKEMMNKNKFWKWLPAFLMMSAIFWFSAQPENMLPNFDWADTLVKKSGHMIGYAMLAFAYWYALDMRKSKRWLAWLLAVAYAMTDEYHQSYSAGRHPSIWDVMIFDNIGALISLWLAGRHIKQKRPDETA